MHSREDNVHTDTHQTGSASFCALELVLSVIGGSCYKYHFCCDKRFVATDTCLSRQNTSFVATKVCRDKSFIAKELSRQNIFCRDRTFVTTNICREKHNFVSVKVLSRQAYFCRDKHVFLATKQVFCRDKSMLV